jgi:hypothetical protein
MELNDIKQPPQSVHGNNSFTDGFTLPEMHQQSPLRQIHRARIEHLCPAQRAESQTPSWFSPKTTIIYNPTGDLTTVCQKQKKRSNSLATNKEFSQNKNQILSKEALTVFLIELI